jgi:hypothetical protein
MKLTTAEDLKAGDAVYFDPESGKVRKWFSGCQYPPAGGATKDISAGTEIDPSSGRPMTHEEFQNL